MKVTIKIPKGLPIALLGVLLLVTLYVHQTYFPSTQIGSLVEGSDYEAKYYVNLFPLGNDESQNFRVIADIEKEEGIYYIKKVSFPDGTAVSFRNMSLKLNQKMLVVDTKGQPWNVLLTDVQADKEDCLCGGGNK